MKALRWVYDDGGRAAAGMKGSAGDCVCRAISIASGISYRAIYRALGEAAIGEGGRGKGRAFAVATGRASSARNGMLKPTTKEFLRDLGWTWTPTMRIGSGCTVHLREGELPTGRLIVSCSGHLTAVLDGVIHDTYDPSRDGMRCVYGYWKAVSR